MRRRRRGRRKGMRRRRERIKRRGRRRRMEEGGRCDVRKKKTVNEMLDVINVFYDEER